MLRSWTDYIFTFNTNDKVALDKSVCNMQKCEYNTESVIWSGGAYVGNVGSNLACNLVPLSVPHHF